MLNFSSVDSLVSSIDLLPVILSPSLAIVVFFVTRELTRNDVVALFASFLTVVSAQVLAGTYGGYYSNWLGLIIGYLSILFLFRYGRIGGRLDILVFGGLIVSLLFTHVYTWSIFCIVIGILLAVCLIKKFYPRKRTIILFSVLLLSIGIDLVKMTLTESSGGIEQDMEIAGRRDAWEQFALRWNNLVRTSFTYVGGLLSNVIIFSLALYWVMTSRFHGVTNVFLITYLSLGILPVFVGDVVVQARVLYNIPFQIPAAITLGVISLTPRYRVIAIPLVTWLIANSLNLSMNLNGPISQS
jgi:MFS family permease